MGKSGFYPKQACWGPLGACGESTVYLWGAPHRVIGLLAPRSLLRRVFRGLRSAGNSQFGSISPLLQSVPYLSVHISIPFGRDGILP
jgi:hypothetical protein